MGNQIDEWLEGMAHTEAPKVGDVYEMRGKLKRRVVVGVYGGIVYTAIEGNPYRVAAHPIEMFEALLEKVDV